MSDKFVAVVNRGPAATRGIGARIDSQYLDFAPAIVTIDKSSVWISADDDELSIVLRFVYRVFTNEEIRDGTGLAVALDGGVFLETKKDSVDLGFRWNFAYEDSYQPVMFHRVTRNTGNIGIDYLQGFTFLNRHIDFAFSSTDVQPMGDGMPLPWPYPW